MFFTKELDAYTPSIHEMRMGQLFPSSNYKDNYKKTKKRNNEYDFSFITGEKTKTIKRKKSFLQVCIDDISSFDLKKTNLFQITPDIAYDYYLYKIKKEGKIRNTNFSFYDIDGSINCSRVFDGLFSDNPYTKEKAKYLLREVIAEFTRSEAFIDYVSMIFACSVATFLFFSLFFNASTFFEYYLNFLF